MKKTTLRELRTLVKDGIAIELKDIDEALSLETIRMSFGVYGMTGALLIDNNNGKLYAIIGRTSTLFYYV